MKLVVSIVYRLGAAEKYVRVGLGMSRASETGVVCAFEESDSMKEGVGSAVSLSLFAMVMARLTDENLERWSLVKSGMKVSSIGQQNT